MLLASLAIIGNAANGILRALIGWP